MPQLSVLLYWGIVFSVLFRFVAGRNSLGRIIKLHKATRSDYIISRTFAGMSSRTEDVIIVLMMLPDFWEIKVIKNAVSMDRPIRAAA